MTSTIPPTIVPLTTVPPTTVPHPKKLKTEDLGKEFEKGLCSLYETEYTEIFKYSLEEADNIKTKFERLKYVFPHKLKHTAGNGNKYDFTSCDDENIHLSAKTAKKHGKFCPQVIGQPTKKKFCQFFCVELDNADAMKEYIIQNLKQLLDVYVLHTFDCPIAYYNRYKNKSLFIRLKTKIDWNNYDITFTHQIKNKTWLEGTTIKINNVSIGEFQIHNHRDCVKFRWYFENLLQLFKDHFEIIDLSSP